MIGSVTFDENTSIYFVYPPKNVDTTNSIKVSIDGSLRVSDIWKPGESRKEVKEIYNYLSALSVSKMMEKLALIEKSSKGIIKYNL